MGKQKDDYDKGKRGNVSEPIQKKSKKEKRKKRDNSIQSSYTVIENKTIDELLFS